MLTVNKKAFILVALLISPLESQQNQVYNPDTKLSVFFSKMVPRALKSQLL